MACGILAGYGQPCAWVKALPKLPVPQTERRIVARTAAFVDDIAHAASGSFEHATSAIVDAALALGARLRALQLHTASISDLVARPPKVRRLIVRILAVDGADTTCAQVGRDLGVPSFGATYALRGLRALVRAEATASWGE